MTACPPIRRIDIVIPVYNAPEDLRRCVESVVACTSDDYRLLLIDDGSIHLGVGEVFREIEQRGDRRIELLHNERNLGFTATANRGMAHSRADVVLLNSDTIVTRGYSGKPMRVITNPYVEEMEKNANQINRFPEQLVDSAMAGVMRYADEDGTDVERTCMPAGQGIGGIIDVLPVADIMSRMLREAEETIGRLSTTVRG